MQSQGTVNPANPMNFVTQNCSPRSSDRRKATFPPGTWSCSAMFRSVLLGLTPHDSGKLFALHASGLRHRLFSGTRLDDSEADVAQYQQQMAKAHRACLQDRRIRMGELRDISMHFQITSRWAMTNISQSPCTTPSFPEASSGGSFTLPFHFCT